jgi:hypothetical protein
MKVAGSALAVIVEPCVIQLAGPEGVGKTALAAAVARKAANVMVAEKDIFLWGLLRGGVERTLAGPLAYDQMFAAAEVYVSRGVAAVIDSPVFSPTTLRNSLDLAQRLAVRHIFVDCLLADDVERARRLQDPMRLPCQAHSLGECQVLATIRPSNVMSVDMSKPLNECALMVVSYLSINGLCRKPERRLGR